MLSVIVKTFRRFATHLIVAGLCTASYGEAFSVQCVRNLGSAAEVACQLAIKNDPRDVRSLLEFAGIRLDQGRPSEAIKLLEQARTADSQNYDVRLLLSMAKEAQQKSSQTQVTPSLSGKHKLNVLRCKTRKGKVGLSACKRALAQIPTDAVLLKRKAYLLASLKPPPKLVPKSPPKAVPKPPKEASRDGTEQSVLVVSRVLKSSGKFDNTPLARDLTF